jgi:hypothetical protein
LCTIRFEPRILIVTADFESLVAAIGMAGGQDGCLARRNEGLVKRDDSLPRSGNRDLSRKGEGQLREAKAGLEEIKAPVEMTGATEDRTRDCVVPAQCKGHSHKRPTVKKR